MGTREGLNDRFGARGVPLASDYEHENSREIERDIQRTRGAMDETIDELVARLQPSEIARGVWTYFKSSSRSASSGPSTTERVSHAASRVGERASDVGSAISHGVRSGGESVAEGVHEGTDLLVRCVRRNPIPSAMVGAGLVYFLVNEFLLSDDQGERRRRDDFDTPLIGAQPVTMDIHEDVYLESELMMSDTPQGIVLPPGSDIDSPHYPLEGADGATSGQQQSTASRVAGKAASGAAAGASAVSHAAGDASSAVSRAAASAGHAAAGAGRSSWQATSRAASSLGHAAAGAGHYGRDAAHGARESLGHAASATYHGASTVGEATVEGLRTTGRAISSGACHTRDAARDATEQYPLLVGLGCVAAGLMTGFLLPRTRREDEAMGETAEEVRHRGYEMGREAVEHGQEMASATASAVMERAEEEGLTPTQLADRLGNVARKAVESTKEAAREEGLTGEELSREATAVKDQAKETVKKEASM